MLIYGLRLRDHDEYRYIGMTTRNPALRLRGHVKHARLGASWPVSSWIRKHAGEVVLDVLEEVTDLTMLKQTEIRIIAEYRQLGHRLLNATRGGDGFVGGKHSTVTKAKISAAGKGRKATEATRASISAARKGFKMSEAQKAKLRALPGRKHTVEERASMSAAMLGRVITDEHRERLRTAALRDYALHPERAEMRRLAQLGKRKVKLKLVILEGPDGAGKSTLAKQIIKDLREQGCATKLLHYGPFTADHSAVVEYRDSLIAQIRGKDAVVCDRFAYGEMVYGPIFRGQSKLDAESLEVIENIFEVFDVTRLYVTAPLDVLVSRLRQRGDKMVSPNQLHAIYAAYEQYLGGSPDWIRYDTTLGATWPL